MTRRSALILFALCLTVAFVLTHLPGGSVPKVSWVDMIPAADKIVHAGLYFVLAALLANCLRFWLRSNRVIVVLTLGTLAAYAAFDEWSQQFSPHRSPDFIDFLADMIGATCGVNLFAVWRWLRRQKRRIVNGPPVQNANPATEKLGNANPPPATVAPQTLVPASSSPADLADPEADPTEWDLVPPVRQHGSQASGKAPVTL